jgi:hypothetical protein
MKKVAAKATKMVAAPAVKLPAKAVKAKAKSKSKGKM